MVGEGANVKEAQILAHAASDRGWSRVVLLKGAEVEIHRDEVDVDGREILFDTDVEPACLIVDEGIKGDNM